MSASSVRDGRGGDGSEKRSTADLFDRALSGTLSEEEVSRSASAVIDAAIWSDWCNDSKSPGAGVNSGLSFFRAPSNPEQRNKLVQSIVQHPERTRRLFRS